MTGRQKFLMQLAHKYCPHYSINNVATIKLK